MASPARRVKRSTSVAWKENLPKPKVPYDEGLLDSDSRQTRSSLKAASRVKVLIIIHAGTYTRSSREA